MAGERAPLERVWLDASTMANLGEALRYRYMLTVQDRDLREALEVTRQAVATASQDADAARRWFGRAPCPIAAPGLILGR